VYKKAVGFLLNLILTRTIRATLYGIFSYMLVIFSLSRVFTLLGRDKSMLRCLPECDGHPGKQNAIVILAYATSLVGSLAATGLVYVLAPIISAYTLKSPLFINVLRIAALALPF